MRAKRHIAVVAGVLGLCAVAVGIFRHSARSATVSSDGPATTVFTLSRTQFRAHATRAP